jgi:type I restriction enzyme R subunit
MDDYQSEAELEKELIAGLQGLKYEFITINNEDELYQNFRKQIDTINHIKLSDREFDRLLNSMLGKSRFESAKNLRQDQEIEFDTDGKKHSVRIFDKGNWCNNVFQVTHQVTMQGKHENRYDVTILINGLPLVQIELKRRGMDLKKAFNQICRYQRDSYKNLFYYIQIFVISNGVNTRYYANNLEMNKDFVFTWQDADNKPVNNLMAFAGERLTPCALAKTISEYMVLDGTYKTLIAMRPYQVRAVEALVNLAETTKNNGYIWHTTGSGKTITSFKVAQILRTMKNVSKVVFLIDRKDLNTQTADEFNKFEKNCFTGTQSGSDLIPAFRDSTANLIMTTIQKMSNVCKSSPKAFEPYKDSTIFIIDECHRSNFGEMHKNIKKVFTGSQFFGFTGTPIFEENKADLDFTTAAVFGECKDKYRIGEAIRDHAVLGFNVYYYNTIKVEPQNRELNSLETNDLIRNKERVASVSEKVLDTYSKVTFEERYNAIFAVKDIDLLLLYYDELRKQDQGKHKICACFTFEANDELEKGATESQRDALDRIIKDYNQIFGTSFSTDNGQTSAYYIDIQKRMKAREIDLLLVVDMFLTGFDSKRLGALYLDKTMQYHRLIQAFSRTNRLDGESKPHGNIVCFDTQIPIVGKTSPQRILGTFKDDTDKAVALFAGEAKDVVLVGKLEDYIDKFVKNRKTLEAVAKKPEDVDLLQTDADKVTFLNLFRDLVKTVRILNTFVDFEWNKEQLGMSRQTYEDYLSKYKDLAEAMKHPGPDPKKEEVPADFYLELVQNDRIDFEYIMNLLKGTIQSSQKGASERLDELKKIIKILEASSSDTLKYKKELLTKFINEVAPTLDKDADVDAEFDKFVESEKKKDIEAKANELDVAYDELWNIVKDFAIYEYVPDSSIESIINKRVIERRKMLKNIKAPNFKVKGDLVDEVKRYIEEICKKYF